MPGHHKKSQLRSLEAQYASFVPPLGFPAIAPTPRGKCSTESDPV